ncbi:hypothetical protein [Paenibacillus sp. GCM10027626]|uniref:hypothetical protein n=1 Tax=Paenibacillus sp. GCM10027626 TaxID=3273411 RepID=UPI00363AB24B
MSALKQVKHLDYAVYGNLIVPMLMFGTDVWFRIDEDSDAGKCRIVCRPRRKR